MISSERLSGGSTRDRVICRTFALLQAPQPLGIQNLLTFATNEKTSAHQGRRQTPRYHPACIGHCPMPLRFALTGESRHRLFQDFTGEACPIPGRQASSTLAHPGAVLPEYHAGLPPRSPDSLRDWSTTPILAVIFCLPEITIIRFGKFIKCSCSLDRFHSSENSFFEYFR